MRVKHKNVGKTWPFAVYINGQKDTKRPNRKNLTQPTRLPAANTAPRKETNIEEGCTVQAIQEENFALKFDDRPWNSKRLDTLTLQGAPLTNGRTSPHITIH